MSMQTCTPKKMGRPWTDTEAVHVRMERPLLDALDASIAEHPGLRPSRPEIVRGIVAAWATSRVVR